MLKHRREALPDTDAEWSDPVVNLAAIHLVNQCCCKPSAAGAKRMADRDRAALDVDAVHVKVEFANTGDGLCCKCLVEFEEADIVDRESGPIEGLAGGWNRAESHRRRINASRG